MTKEQMDGLLKGLEKLGLGADDGSALHKPQPIRSDALLMSVIPVPFIWSCVQSSLGHWGKLRTSSRMYPIDSKTRDAPGTMKMARLCLNLWATFETPSLIAK